MMIQRILAAVLACVPLSAVATEQLIGNWHVSVEVDRFGKTVAGFPPPTDVFVTTEQGGHTLAVRCIHNKLTIALVDAAPDRYSRGEEVRYFFRADRGDVVRGFANAIEGNTIEMVAKDGMVVDMTKAKEAAFRIIRGNVEFDRVFALKGAKKAFAALDGGCVLE
ncbi:MULTISPECIES: hypothetical protein [unclassified Bradyrhizobium]|uniref:hypothetical protein n=1 Tax=unclassified Bradyrhizobium TaxID=2631580 RepID=UPI0028E5AEA8|nr:MULTISPECIES: hypothetical protein [unclassified Bradyrhizobium]